VLDEIDKSISVSDIPAAQGYKILNDANQVLISLTQMRADEEEAPAEAAPAEPELIRKPREDDEQ